MIGRVAAGGGVRSGGVGPPKPARRPQGGESGERVTQHERTPPPDDGTRPPRALMFVNDPGQSVVYSASHTVSSWLLRKWLGVMVQPRTFALWGTMRCHWKV